MSLLDLPTEVLQLIIAESMPEGFEHLMLSCKSVHHAGKDFIESHARLKNAYRSFSYGPRIESSVQLIYEIAKEPLIGRYIENANLYEDCIPECFAKCGADAWNRLLGDNNAVETVKRALEQSAVLRTCQIDAKSWFEAMVEEYKTEGELSYTSSTFVLSLLPNVQEMTVPREWNYFPSAATEDRGTAREEPDVWKLLDSLVYHARNGTDGPLAKLRRVDGLGDGDYEYRASTQIFNPFMALPSIRDMKLDSCVAVRDSYTGIPFDWRYPSVLSDLESIEMACSCVSGDQLANIVRHTPKLRSFKLAYQTKWHGCGHDLDVNEIFAVLAQYSGNSLEDLSVTLDQQFGVLKGGLCSFKDFTHLKSLELDVRFFFGPPVTADLRALSPEDYRAHSTFSCWRATFVPKLIDILPCSIKSVRILAGSSAEEPAVLESLFASLAEARDNLPFLSRVVLDRAISRVGKTSVAGGQNLRPWLSVRRLLKTAGYSYQESATVEAVWLPHGSNEPDMVLYNDSSSQDSTFEP